MGEHWTRPPLVARERPPAWRATWRFRLAALLLLVLLVAATVQLYRVLSGATAQDPGVDAVGQLEPAAGTAGNGTNTAN